MNPMMFDIRLLGEFQIETPESGYASLYCKRCFPWTHELATPLNLLQVIDVALNHWNSTPH